MPPLLLPLCFGLFVNFIIDINGLYGLVMKVVIFVCIYIALFFLLGLGFQERAELIGKVKDFVKRR